jgi:predicted negative regulator of RcsB-dependent stress response
MLFWGALLAILLLASNAKAQDYDIQRFDANVQLQPSSNLAQIQAKITVINNTTQGRSGPFINFKLNKRAKVSAAQIDGTSVEVRSKGDERLTELNNVSLDFPKALAPGASATINLTYALEIKESSSIGAIVPSGTVLLPESFWLPFVHTPFAITYGVDFAPVNLQISGAENERPQSDGLRKVSGNTITFEQNIPAQPILLSGSYDEPLEIKGRDITVEFLYPRALTGNPRKQAENLTKEIQEILDFYSQTLGFNTPKQFRIISSSQVPSYATGTTLILSEDLFRRDSLDIETIEFLARALLKSKIGGEVAPRGRGWTILQDALPVYLAGHYFEKRFGAIGGQEFFARRLRTYAPTASTKNDGALLGLSPIDNTYSTSMLNKAPLMLRAIEQQISKEKMFLLIKDLFNSKNRQIRFDDFRKAAITANKDLELLFDQWFEKIVDPDFIIGVPIATESGWACALRNLGTGNVQVKVLAVTEKGEKLSQNIVIPSQGRAEAIFKTTDKITSVEVDPDKLYPQTNFDNDSRPVITSAITLFKDANILFNKRSYSEAEPKIREALSREPNNAVLRTLLARTLFAQNKLSEAKTEIDTILASNVLPIYSLTWVNYILGELALNQKNSKDAIDYLRKAIVVSKDNTFIRNKLIDVEQAANQVPPSEESVKAFMGQLDKAIKDSTPQALETVILRANLNKFVRGLIGNKPDSWVTDILRIETISANKVAVDVIVTAVDISKREQSGEALYILQRNNNSWILSSVEFFNIE